MASKNARFRQIKPERCWNRRGLSNQWKTQSAHVRVWHFSEIEQCLLSVLAASLDTD
jgi:hypothetical protein